MTEKEKTANDILAAHRVQIDALDKQLIRILAQRFAVVQDVARLKKQHDIGVIQTNRAQQVVENAATNAAELGLDPEFARTILKACIDHAHTLEHDWMNKT